MFCGKTEIFSVLKQKLFCTETVKFLFPNRNIFRSETKVFLSQNSKISVSKQFLSRLNPGIKRKIAHCETEKSNDERDPVDSPTENVHCRMGGFDSETGKSDVNRDPVAGQTEKHCSRTGLTVSGPGVVPGPGPKSAPSPGGGSQTKRTARLNARPRRVGPPNPIQDVFWSAQTVFPILF